MSENDIDPNLLYDARFDGWTYQIHPLNTPACNFGCFSKIIDMYRSKMKSGKLASWDDMDFYDFVGWHGHVGLMEDTGREPFDLIDRLCGTYLVECFEADLTNTLVSNQLNETEESMIEDLKFFEAVCRTPGIGIAHGTATWSKKEYKYFTLIYIPLADDYENANKILYLIIDSSPKQPLTRSK